MEHNVVLLCLDSVRKDYYDEYAPRLERRAGTTFERAYAASNWSMPSHASMFTGELPHEHDVHPSGVGTFGELTPTDTFLDELTGYSTYGISANTYAGSGFEFDQLFDSFLDYSPSALFQDALKPQILQKRTGLSGRERYANFVRRSVGHERPIKSLLNGIWGVAPGKERLARSKLFPYSKHRGVAEMADIARGALSSLEEPFFAFANFMDAHVPFTPIPAFDDELHSAPTGWSTDDLDPDVKSTPRPPGGHEEEVHRYRDLYRCEIDYLDRVLASFVDDIDETTSGETSFVVVSDHGENLGYPADEYLLGHNSMSHAILHTPCSIVNPPPDYPDTVSGSFSHLELRTLVRDLAAGREFDPDIVWDAVPAESPRVGGLRRSAEPDAPRFERMARCLVRDDRKHLWDSLGARELYDLEFSFPSSESLVSEDASIPSEAADYFDVPIEEYLARTDRSDAESMDLDPETRGQLEGLGYL